MPMAVDRAVQTPVGLLIVHGIGNQRVGALSAAIAARLTDPGASPEQTTNLQRGGQGLHNAEFHRVCVDDVPVLVHEAHWAFLSHPDNPPRVRDSSDVVSEFYTTVRAAWLAASQISRSRATSAPNTGAKPMFVWLGIAAILNGLVVLAWLFDRFELKDSDVGAGLFGLSLACLGIYSSLQAVRRWRSQRSAGTRESTTWRFVKLLVAILWGFYRPFFFLLGAEMLFFMSLAVFAAYPVNLAGWLLAQPFRAAGWVSLQLGLPSLTRWFHRLGCVMVVLPTHSFLQAVKTSGNLFSILFSERGAVVRVNAILWFFWVLAGFVVLLLFSELLVLIPIFMFLPDAEAGSFQASLAEKLIVFSIVTPFYLLFLKVVLPAIDLVLDVSNYQLASRPEREEYFARLDQEASALIQAGCREIHVLAHSLGSVITYDWLHAREPKTYPVVTLHTIGSPLDKFWYIDHAQPGRRVGKGGLQERIAGAWLNYYAWSDSVSGHLDRYDAPALKVVNYRLRWLGPWMWSHGLYWSNRTVIRALRSLIAKSP